MQWSSPAEIRLCLLHCLRLGLFAKEFRVNGQLNVDHFFGRSEQPESQKFQYSMLND